jgi:hypothetical protein
VKTRHHPVAALVAILLIAATWAPAQGAVPTVVSAGSLSSGDISFASQTLGTGPQFTFLFTIPQNELHVRTPEREASSRSPTGRSDS